MFVKAGIAAAALLGAVLLISLDFREIYNEMYPVNRLRRDVLGLCHQIQPAFIRAARSDRQTCYDSMPDSVAKAIGWVPTSTRLTAPRQPPSAIELAEQRLANADAPLGSAGRVALRGSAVDVDMAPARLIEEPQGAQFDLRIGTAHP